MPPKANKPTVSKATADRWKNKAEDYRKKYLAFRRETKKNEPIDAAMNAGIFAVSGIGTGLLRGAIPDTFAWGEGANRTEMDWTWVKDIGGLVIGGGTMAGGVWAETPELVYAGGGAFTVSAAALAERLTRMGREEAQKWWRGENGNGAGTGTAPPLAAVPG